MLNDLVYKKILLKISGEALSSIDGKKDSYGICPYMIDYVAKSIGSIHAMGVKVAVVVGGGNIYRGMKGSKHYQIERSASDHMGMLATVINGIAVNNALNAYKIQSRLMSSVSMHTICEPFSINKANKYLESNKVVIFVGGTGNPYFTTDTAATLRACETNCDILLKATKVKGIFSNDPVVDNNAQFIKNITYKEIFDRGIKVMDNTAIEMALENKLPIGVFSIYEKDLLPKIVKGEGEFTLVSNF